MDTRIQSENLSTARMSPKSELAKFKRLVEHAKAFILPPDQAMLFRPSKVSSFGLGPADVLSFVPCARFDVHIDSKDATRVMQAVLSMEMLLNYGRK